MKTAGTTGKEFRIRQVGSNFCVHFSALPPWLRDFPPWHGSGTTLPIEIPTEGRYLPGMGCRGKDKRYNRRCRNEIHGAEQMMSRKGFSLIEAVVVMGIGAILAMVTITSFGAVRGSMTVNAARGTFQSMHATTRALAVERGVLMRLVADPADATVRIEVGCAGGGAVVQTETLPANIVTGGGVFAICMTPRGYANPAGNSFVNEGTISFTQAGRTVQLRYLPLGQAIAP